MVLELVELCPVPKRCIFYTSSVRGFFTSLVWKGFFMSVLLGSPSVLSPLDSGRNSTMFYYTLPIGLPTIQKLLDNRTIREELLSPLSKSCMTVCFLYYARIQEILNCTVSDVVHPDRVVVHGLKKSMSYIIFLPGLTKQMSIYKDLHGASKLFPTTYIKLYRDSLKIGLQFEKTNNKNKKRLHASRYIFAKKAMSCTKVGELTSLLRHKNSHNYLYYL